MKTREITPTERAELAALAGINEQYLYQCLTGRSSMRPDTAVEVERLTERRLRRWDLRTVDWHSIWPELVGSEGAPEVPEKAA